MSSGIDLSQAIKPNSKLYAQEAAAQVLSSAHNPATSEHASAAQQDSVHLSQEGSILTAKSQDHLKWGLPVKTLPPIPHSAAELNTWFSNFRDGVRKSIEKIISQNNIQLKQPVTLQKNSDGSVRVSGDHPQAQQIQKLVDQNPQIGDQLQSLSQRADLYQVLSHGNDLRHSSNDSEHSQAAAALSNHLNNPAPTRLTVSPSSSAGTPSSHAQA